MAARERRVPGRQRVGCPLWCGRSERHRAVTADAGPGERARSAGAQPRAFPCLHHLPERARRHASLDRRARRRLQTRSRAILTQIAPQLGHRWPLAAHVDVVDGLLDPLLDVARQQAGALLRPRPHHHERPGDPILAKRGDQSVDLGRAEPKSTGRSLDGGAAAPRRRSRGIAPGRPCGPPPAGVVGNVEARARDGLGGLSTRH